MPSCIPATGVFVASAPVLNTKTRTLEHTLCRRKRIFKNPKTRTLEHTLCRRRRERASQWMIIPTAVSEFALASLHVHATGSGLARARDRRRVRTYCNHLSIPVSLRSPSSFRCDLCRLLPRMIPLAILTIFAGPRLHIVIALWHVGAVWINKPTGIKFVVYSLLLPHVSFHCLPREYSIL